MGDMSSASSILEHMKQSEMALNESVFHSLIVGHATAGDITAAKDTMRVMTEQGLAHSKLWVGGAKDSRAWLLGS